MLHVAEVELFVKGYKAGFAHEPQRVTSICFGLFNQLTGDATKPPRLVDHERGQFNRAVGMRFELYAADNPLLAVDGNSEALPIESQWIDPRPPYQLLNRAIFFKPRRTQPNLTGGVIHQPLCAYGSAS